MNQVASLHAPHWDASPQPLLGAIAEGVSGARRIRSGELSSSPVTGVLLQSMRQVMTLAPRVFAPRLSVRPPLCLTPRHKVLPSVRVATDLESPLAQLQELFGATGDDPGHWNLSPEWFGTQNGGWGRNAGQEVFSADSAHGNGRVTVTAHEASQQEGSPGAVQEWRVLRFNDATRQSVARVTLTPPSVATVSSPAPAISSTYGTTAHDGKPESTGQHSEQDIVFLPSAIANDSVSSGGGWTMLQQADCLAPEYLKTMASLAAALVGLQGLLPSAGHSHDGPGSPAVLPRQGTLRVLCIGLGGGSLPLFLTHHFPGAVVDAVELDPVVLAAATQAMGLPTTLPNLRLHRADAFQFVGDLVEQQQQEQQQGQQEQGPLYDLVFLDAFDGEDNVPEALCSPEFARLLASALHPRHGTLVINMHNKDPARPVNLPGFILGKMAPPGDLGYDPKSPTGQKIVEVAETFAAALHVSSTSECSGCRGRRDAVSSRSGEGNRVGDPSRDEGIGQQQMQVPVRAFTVSVPKQLNVEVVVARGLKIEQDAGLAALQVKAMAAYVAGLAGYRFPAGRRAVRGFYEFL